MEQQIYKGKLTQFHGLKIAKKEDLTKNTFSLELEIPENLKENFKFEAGQFVSVKFNADGKEVINDYSMTSAPYEEKITLGIKINSQNGATAELYKKYQAGDELLVSEPNGRFTIVSKPSEFRTIVCFAAGIGITPILSHFKNILYNEPRTRLFLFLGNKSSEELIYRDLLDNLAHQYGERLQIFYFYSQEKTADQFFYGRLDAQKLNLIINQILHLDDTDEESTIWDAVDEVLICGKGEMIKTLANACYHHGIPKKNIHFELFTTPGQKIVETNTSSVDKDEQLKSLITIKLDGRSFSFELAYNNGSILDEALKQGADLPYACKGGVCSSCRARLTQGKVSMDANYALEQEEVAAGFILTCQSHPLTEKVVVDFDLR